MKLLSPPTDLTDAQRTSLYHLTRYIPSLSKDKLLVFLQFVFGDDIMPESPIKVAFVNQIPRAPRARTCVPKLVTAMTLTIASLKNFRLCCVILKVTHFWLYLRTLF